MVEYYLHFCFVYGFFYKYSYLSVKIIHLFYSNIFDSKIVIKIDIIFIIIHGKDSEICKYVSSSAFVNGFSLFCTEAMLPQQGLPLSPYKPGRHTL